MDKAEILAQIMFEEDEIRHNNNENTIYFTKEDFEAEQKEREKEMDIKTMDKTELITLKKEINAELYNRIKIEYDKLESNLIKLITDFETTTGYYVGFDDGEWGDKATNVIKSLFYFTEEYIKPYD